MEDDMVEILSLLANLSLIGVVFMYFRQVVKSESTPNPASWLIWLIVLLMNTVSYYDVVAGNLWKWAFTLISTVGVAITIPYALLKGKLGKLGVTELLSLTLALVIGVFWQTTGDAITANLLLQVILLISFVPTVLGLLREELHEQTPPWDLAFCAYVFLILAIVIDWKEGSAIALVHPIVNGIIGNGSVALTIRHMHRKKIHRLEAIRWLEK